MSIRIEFVIAIVILFIIHEVILRQKYTHSMSYTKGYVDAHRKIIRLYKKANTAQEFAETFRYIVSGVQSLPKLPNKEED